MYTTPSPKHFIKLNAATNQGFEEAKNAPNPSSSEAASNIVTHTFTQKQWTQNLNNLTNVYTRKESSGEHAVCVCTSLLSAATPRTRHATVRAAKTRAIFAVKKAIEARTNEEERLVERFPQRASWAVFPKWRWGEGGRAYIVRRGEKRGLNGAPLYRSAPTHRL